jgi:hypothetical protein
VLAPLIRGWLALGVLRLAMLAEQFGRLGRLPLLA